MDSTELNQTWNDVCAQVKSYENVDPSQINAFFSRLVPQAMSEGFLMLTADNDFIKTWIERHYLDYIKQALLDLHRVPYTVVIEVDSSQVTNQPAAESASGPAAPAPSPSPAPAPAPSEPEPAPATPSPDESSVARIDAIPTSSLTFENFVIGDSNRMAYSMAVAVAEAPGKAHLNPLFIYGKSGLGKTHLLRAIQNYVRETAPELSTVYVDSAELMADYTEASAAHDRDKSSYKNFKMRYEEADVLLIDDVQWLQGKKQTLDIVFQIFNKLTSVGKQVVLSADRAPKNIDIDERYKSRFNSGGTFDIQPPEIETKLGIVKSFIDEYREVENDPSIVVPDDIQMYIAENSSSNIRELKSAVTKVMYQISYSGGNDLTLDEVRGLLENHFSGGPAKRLTVGDIQSEVESFYKVSHAEIVGGNRSRDIAYARQVCIYLCREFLDLPFADIGKKFNRDHSTAMYSARKVEGMLTKSQELREEIEALTQIIREL